MSKRRFVLLVAMIWLCGAGMVLALGQIYPNVFTKPVACFDPPPNPLTLDRLPFAPQPERALTPGEIKL